MLAQMIHQSNLAGWLVKTAGTAIAIFTAGPLGGAFLASATGDVFWFGLGSFVGVVGMPIYLTSVKPLMPTDPLLDLLERETGKPNPL